MRAYLVKQLKDEGSLQRLLRGSSPTTYILKKTKSRFQLYLTIDSPNCLRAFKASGIETYTNETQLEDLVGYQLLRKEAVQRRRNGSPVGYSNNNSVEFTLMDELSDLRNLALSFGDGDFVYFRFKPFDAPFNPVFTSENNEFFRKAYKFTILSSSVRVTNALLEDLNNSGECFTSGKERISIPTPINDRRFDRYIMGSVEGILIATAIGKLIMSGLKPDITFDGPLSLSKGIMNPGLPIGTINGSIVGIPVDNVKNNIAIVGINGSGKTSLMDNGIIRPLCAAGIPLLIIAPIKTDFSEMHPYAALYRSGDEKHPLRMNLLDLPNDGSAPRIAAKALSMVVSMGGDDSVLPMIFQNALTTMYASDLPEVDLSQLAKFIKDELLSSGYLRENAKALTQSALNRCKTGYYQQEFNASKSNIDLDKIFEKGTISIIELNDMEESFRRTFTAILLEKLAKKYRSMGKTSDIRLVVVIDEVHELLLGNDLNDPFRRVLNSSLNTARGNGVGFVLADQRLELLGELAESGCANHIVMRGRASIRAAELLNLAESNTLIQGIPYLKDGDALLHVSGERTVVVNRLPLDTWKQSNEKNGMLLDANYVPYLSCLGSCHSCDGRLHRIIVDGVIKVLGNGSSYDKYKRSLELIEKDNSLTVTMKVKKRKNIEDELGNECLGIVYRKCEKISGLYKEKDKINIMRNCVREELKRQLAFKI